MGKSKMNPYLTYMLEQKKVVPGWANKSNQELMVLCDKGWKTMGRAERARYSSLSKTMEMGARQKGEVRIGGFDSLGRPLAEIRKRDEERLKIQEERRRLVEGIVEEARQKGELASFKFNVIATNIFVQTEDDPPLLVPAELSVATFSLQAGVEEHVFQVFPSPGPIPIGYRGRCKANSDRSHKVPLNGVIEVPEVCYSDERVDFLTVEADQVCKSLHQLLSRGTNKTIVFTMPHLVDQVEGVLASLYRRTGLPPHPLRVLPLPRLLLELAGKRDVVPTIHMAEVELEKERFLYRPDLSCPWHAAHTDTNHCTSATTRRWCFTVLDLVCKVHKIEMVEGQHVPRGLETKPILDWTEEKLRPLPVFSISRSCVQGKFPAVDIRELKESDAGQDNKKIEVEEKVEKHLTQTNKIAGQLNNNLIEILPEKPDNVQYTGSSTRDTISEFMDNLTMTNLSHMDNLTMTNLSHASDCSTDSEFVDMAALTSSTNHGTGGRGVAPASTGFPLPVRGRGQKLRVKTGGRLAATFPGMAGRK